MNPSQLRAERQRPPDPALGWGPAPSTGVNGDRSSGRGGLGLGPLAPMGAAPAPSSGSQVVTSPTSDGTGVGQDRASEQPELRGPMCRLWPCRGTTAHLQHPLVTRLGLPQRTRPQVPPGWGSSGRDHRITEPPQSPSPSPLWQIQAIPLVLSLPARTRLPHGCPTSTQRLTQPLVRKGQGWVQPKEGCTQCPPPHPALKGCTHGCLGLLSATLSHPMAVPSGLEEAGTQRDARSQTMGREGRDPDGVFPLLFV